MDNLTNTWKIVANNLGLCLVENFSIQTKSGELLQARFLLKNFGAENGMLIFTDYKIVKPYVKEIVDKGYGFSILDEPKSETIKTDEFIDLLIDWGWSGTGDAPSWISNQ